jgi:hypothetical protein
VAVVSYRHLHWCYPSLGGQAPHVLSTSDRLGMLQHSTMACPDTKHILSQCSGCTTVHSVCNEACSAHLRTQTALRSMLRSVRSGVRQVRTMLTAVRYACMFFL